MEEAPGKNRPEREGKSVSRQTITPAVLTIWLAAFASLVTAVNAAHVVEPDKTTEKNYAEEISKNYDLESGPNPFAPGNATSATGTFMPGEMFVPSKRCGTCHTTLMHNGASRHMAMPFANPSIRKNVKTSSRKRELNTRGIANRATTGRRFFPAHLQRIPTSNARSMTTGCPVSLVILFSQLTDEYR